MTLRRSLFAVLVAGLSSACGGDATQTASAGAGGTSSATGGEVGSGGHASGGSASDGASGSGAVCCTAAAVCPTGERTANAAECPGAASCHQLTICCSSIWCVSGDGGAGASGAGGGGATRDCNGTTCTATQACIAYRTEGGVVMLADAGACPAGEHLEGSMCQRDFAYKCAELHGLCQNEPVTCSCAQPLTNNPGVCPVGYGSCSAPAPPADSAAQLICQQLVP